ncbi:zinc-dependent metalloprotease [bacterium]|nr:zinc-dependent metalloprotease [bacterium]
MFLKRFLLLLVMACIVLPVFSALAAPFDVDSVYKGWSGDPDTIKVYIDTSFTAAQKGSVQTAIDRWNDAGGEPKMTATTSSSGADIRIRSSSTISGQGTCAAHPSWSQPYDSCTIKIKPTRTVGLTELATHELGHALGLDDTKNASDVMRGDPGSNGSGGALSSHDSSEAKAAAKIADATSSVMLPLFPDMALACGALSNLGYQLSRDYPPPIAAGAVIWIMPVHDPFLTIYGEHVEGNLLIFDVQLEPIHWSGMVFFDVYIEFPDPLTYPPEEFMCMFYADEAPVPPTDFTCWFDWHTEGGLTYVDWVGRNDYPHPGGLRATLTDEFATHFNKGNGTFVLELPPGSHMLSLVVDDFQGNYSYYTTIIDVLGIDDDPELPSAVALDAYPNPFNSAVTMSLSPGVGASNARPVQVGVEIFDINGRMVYNNSAGDACMRPAGGIHAAPTQVIWQPEASVGSGIYLVRAKVGDKSVTKRIVYLK